MPRAAASALSSSTQPRAAWRMCSFKLRQGDWKGRGRCTLCTGKRPTGRIIFRAQRRTEIRGFLSFVNLCCAAVCGRGGDGWDSVQTGRAARGWRARSVTRNGCAVVSCFLCYAFTVWTMVEDVYRGNTCRKAVVCRWFILNKLLSQKKMDVSTIHPRGFISGIHPILDSRSARDHSTSMHLRVRQNTRSTILVLI